VSTYRYVTLLTNHVRFPYITIDDTALLNEGKTTVYGYETEKCVVV
jgi:hypothetical protein